MVRKAQGKGKKAQGLKLKAQRIRIKAKGICQRVKAECEKGFEDSRIRVKEIRSRDRILKAQS
jgi:hypothetical protein